MDAEEDQEEGFVVVVVVVLVDRRATRLPGSWIFLPPTSRRRGDEKNGNRIEADQTGRVRASIGCVTARNGGFDRHRSQVPDD